MKIIEAGVAKQIEFPDAAALKRYLANLRVDGKNYNIFYQLEFGGKIVVGIVETWRNAPLIKSIMMR